MCEQRKTRKSLQANDYTKYRTMSQASSHRKRHEVSFSFGKIGLINKRTGDECELTHCLISMYFIMYIHDQMIGIRLPFSLETSQVKTIR